MARSRNPDRPCLVFTSCTAAKDDSVGLPASWPLVRPADYLDDTRLVDFLATTRRSIFADARAKQGTDITCAFDLYVRKGRMYKGVLGHSYEPLKRALVVGSPPVRWFFLSGGYGIIDALEQATSYQATFSEGIARQKRIPWTAGAWGQGLAQICESVIEHQPGARVYVFGSRDYTYFLKRTSRWASGDGIKIFESTGASGPFWLSPRVLEFVQAFLRRRLDEFDRRYPTSFLKQPG